jgi:hypothetical protein
MTVVATTRTPGTEAVGWGSTPLHLGQEPEQDGPRRLVLLEVDQQLSEGARLRVTQELADPLGAVEIWEAEDVEEFRRAPPAGVRHEGPQYVGRALPSSIESVAPTCIPRRDSPISSFPL